MDIPLAICTALGLSADATEKQVVSTIAELKTEKDKALNSAASPSLENFVPRADHDIAINRATVAEEKIKAHEEAALNQQIETELESALKKGVITPATVDYHRACCKQEGGLEQFKKFKDAAPTIADNSNLDDKSLDEQGKGLNTEDRAACDLLGISTEDFLKAKEVA